MTELHHPAKYLVVLLILFNHVPLTDGLECISKPDPVTSGQKGTNISINWFCKLQGNEEFRSSYIYLKPYDLHDPLASQHKGEDGFTKYIDLIVLVDFSVFGKENVTLTLHEVQLSSNGTYCLKLTWKLNNEMYDHEMCTNVIIYEPSTITVFYCKGCKNGTNGTVVVNQTISLICNATGIPLPKVAWTKNGQNFSNDSPLIIHQVTKKDTGNYTCFVDNGISNHSRTLSVDVESNKVLTTDQLPVDPTSINIPTTTANIASTTEQQPVDPTSIPSTTDDQTWLTWLIVGLSVLLVIGVAVVTLLCCRKRRHQKNDGENPAVQGNENVKLEDRTKGDVQENGDKKNGEQSEHLVPCDLEKGEVQVVCNVDLVEPFITEGLD